MRPIKFSGSVGFMYNAHSVSNIPYGFDRKVRGLFGGPCFLPDAGITASTPPGVSGAAGVLLSIHKKKLISAL